MTHPLVTTDWLAQHLNDDDLRVIDIRGYVLPATEPPPHYFNERDAYEESHIPMASFIDWVKEITDPDSPHHAQVAPKARFEAAMQRAGVNNSSRVVAYDTSNGMFAARLWWMLRYYGHENVFVLDGGWEKWTAEGHPTTDAAPTHPQGDFTAQPNPALIRHASDIRTAPNTTLVDVRSSKEFIGEASRTDRYGHIPDALNFPRKAMINDDGTLRPASSLRADFEKLGIAVDAPEVITYCNGGVSAAYALLALNVAGYENVALYDGSWKDWTHDPKNEIE